MNSQTNRTCGSDLLVIWSPKNARTVLNHRQARSWLLPKGETNRVLVYMWIATAPRAAGTWNSGLFHRIQALRRVEDLKSSIKYPNILLPAYNHFKTCFSVMLGHKCDASSSLVWADNHKRFQISFKQLAAALRAWVFSFFSTFVEPVTIISFNKSPLVSSAWRRTWGDRAALARGGVFNSPWERVKSHCRKCSQRGRRY